MSNSSLPRVRAPFAFGHEAILCGLLAALLLFAIVSDADFLQLSVQIKLSSLIWELAILAIPMTLIIITGGIDLSIGSTMALSAVVLGLTFEHGYSPFLGAFLALLTGAAAGALNGFFVARIKVHPLIVTLATLAAYRGVAEGISLARPISGFPESFALLSAGSLAGISLPGALFILIALAAALILARTPFGAWLYAIGHNETATRFSGVPVARIKWLLYTLSGSAAALAAILFVARRNTAKADIGQGIELEVITAVVLGGASIFGGRGHIPGTILGVLLIHETREFVSWHWNRDELKFIVLGVLLIGSVLLHSTLARDGATRQAGH